MENIQKLAALFLIASEKPLLKDVLSAQEEALKAGEKARKLYDQYMKDVNK